MAPNRSKQKPSPGKQKPAKAAAAPAFDEAALSHLTAKIEQNLSKPAGKQPQRQPQQSQQQQWEQQQQRQQQQKQQPDHAGKRKRNGVEERDAKPNKRQAQFRDSRPNRNRDSGKKPPASKDDKAALLLEEIRALGGDEADLELVAGIDSDAEGGQEKASEKPLGDDFKKELASFVSGLGLEDVRDDAAVGDSESESESAEEGEDGDADEDEAGEQTQAKNAVSELPKNPKFQKLIFEPRPDWHAANPGSLPPPDSDDIAAFSSAIASLKSYAETLLEEDVSAYSRIVSSSSTHRFTSTIMSSGTMSDKVSALTLEIQESPIHNIKAFESLMTLAAKKSRGQAISALSALVDLLGNGVVLPSDRRLRFFQAQPGLAGSLQEGLTDSWRPGQSLPSKLTKSHLVMWKFEDWLKDAYFRVIQLLEVWCGDEIEYSRSRALDFVFGLLRDKPEQEANLLRLLVNKLGDRERKIASRASYLILQLLNIHPGMKAVVIRAVEQEILLRPGQSLRAKYYAINTLNQTILSSKEPAIADTLVRIYFELFLTLLKGGTLGAIEIPESEAIAKNGPANGKHGGKKQKPELQGEKKDKKKPQDDKVGGSERDTAEKLVSAILTGINRAVPFSMTDESTLEKHLDTLFRVTHSSNFNTSIQALMLVQQVAVSKHIAVDRFYRTLYESLLDPRLVTSSKQSLYLNLLFRALKNDVDVRRVKAFVKRMLQIVNLHQPSFTCGVLYLIAELESTFPDLKTLLNEPEDNDADEEEVYKDIVEEEDGSAQVNGESKEDDASSAAPKKSSTYDGRKRDPEYSNAQRSCLWELVPYLGHFHPTVAAFAANLLVRQKSLPKPDLANHTLMHFLDKFVYRNPKATESKRGVSIMQPVLAAGSAAHIVGGGKTASKSQASVNTAAFWNKKAQDVAAEDVFFHEYFSQVGKPGQAARKAKKTKEDAGSETDSEAEGEIWQALVDSRPELHGDDADADMDMDMSEGDSDLGSLLDMSDSDMDDEELLGSQESDGSVEFVDFSDEEDAGGEREEAPEGVVGGRPTSKENRARRKEMKALPVFASAEDYAEMLGKEEDGQY